MAVLNHEVALSIVDELNKYFKEHGIAYENELDEIKREFVRRYHLKKFPANYEILVSLTDDERKKYNSVLGLLQTKPNRTLSGVAPLAVMTYPFPCPHGKCITCPGGPKSEFGDVPQSYTGREPAAMRAIRNNYDPYLQVFNRLQQYALLNHNFQKVEIIVMGGTFMSFAEKYKYEFVYYLYKALNDFSDYFFTPEFNFSKLIDFFELNQEMSEEREKRVKLKILKLKYSNFVSFSQSENKAKEKLRELLKKEQEKNERANVRAVAFCVETRPDYCFEEHINEMLDFGVTRVEIGVQSVFDDVLEAMNRGHTVEDVVRATQLAKDSFLKVTYHIMPGLPGSNIEKDYEVFRILFSDERFKPDALKIYPTLVIRGTKLWDLWKTGKYKALTLDETIDLLVKVKQIIPEYCRIMRIQRDIPSDIPDAGIKVSNLRQLVHEKLNKALKLQEELKNGMDESEVKRRLNELHLDIFDLVKNQKLHDCNCIRCREFSRKIKTLKDNHKLDPDENIEPEVEFRYIYYDASKGKEVFIQLVDPRFNALVGFVRLRKPYLPFRPEIKNSEDSVGIRELHVYGTSMPLETSGKLQHHGYGKMLMKEAERIARKEFNAKKIFVISGIGVKEYYYKMGYQKDGVYVSKEL